MSKSDIFMILVGLRKVGLFSRVDEVLRAGEIDDFGFEGMCGFEDTGFVYNPVYKLITLCRNCQS